VGVQEENSQKRHFQANARRNCGRPAPVSENPSPEKGTEKKTKLRPPVKENPLVKPRKNVHYSKMVNWFSPEEREKKKNLVGEVTKNHCTGVEGREDIKRKGEKTKVPGSETILR